jgi:hypothetical protein
MSSRKGTIRFYSDEDYDAMGGLYDQVSRLLRVRLDAWGLSAGEAYVVMSAFSVSDLSLPVTREVGISLGPDIIFKLLVEPDCALGVAGAGELCSEQNKWIIINRLLQGGYDDLFRKAIAEGWYIGVDRVAIIRPGWLIKLVNYWNFPLNSLERDWMRAVGAGGNMAFAQINQIETMWNGDGERRREALYRLFESDYRYIDLAWAMGVGIGDLLCGGSVDRYISFRVACDDWAGQQEREGEQEKEGDTDA